MFFLNGKREFIKPENSSDSFTEQLQNCIIQLKGINSGKRIFKLNIFVDSESLNHYTEIKKEVEQKIVSGFRENIILNFIAQPPLGCKIIIEAFYYNDSFWDFELISHPNGNAIHFLREGTQFIIGNVQVNNQLSRQLQYEMAFESLKEVLGEKDFPMGSIIRQWNYIENINGLSNKKC